MMRLLTLKLDIPIYNYFNLILPAVFVKKNLDGLTNSERFCVGVGIHSEVPNPN